MAINTVTNDLGLVNEIIGYYSSTAFPNWMPEVVTKVEGELTQSVSDSQLCHAPVTQWCVASRFEENSPD